LDFFIISVRVRVRVRVRVAVKVKVRGWGRVWVGYITIYYLIPLPSSENDIRSVCWMETVYYFTLSNTRRFHCPDTN
jgi:hypothetical protein